MRPGRNRYPANRDNPGRSIAEAPRGGFSVCWGYVFPVGAVFPLFASRHTSSQLGGRKAPGSIHQQEKFMHIAFTGFTTTLQSAAANSRKYSSIGGLAALMAVASLTALVPTPVLAQATGEFLPLPAQARPQDEPPEGFRLQRAGRNGYVVIAGFYQATFVVTSEGVVLIDAPPSLADKLPVAIKSVTSKPVTYVILTHDHYDHIGAATK